MSAPSLPAADVSAIEKRIEEFSQCLEAGNFDRWVSFWAEDGVLMPEGHPRVTGHQALVDHIRANYGNVRSITLSDWSIIGEGSLAVATNNVQWTDGATGQPAAPMKQVIVLTRNAAGKWLLKSVIFNHGV